MADSNADRAKTERIFTRWSDLLRRLADGATNAPGAVDVRKTKPAAGMVTK